MAYDWSGVRTRRIRRLKMAVASCLGLMVLAAPVLAFT